MLVIRLNYSLILCVRANKCSSGSRNQNGSTSGLNRMVPTSPGVSTEMHLRVCDSVTESTLVFLNSWIKTKILLQCFEDLIFACALFLQNLFVCEKGLFKWRGVKNFASTKNRFSFSILVWNWLFFRSNGGLFRSRYQSCYTTLLGKKFSVTSRVMTAWQTTNMLHLYWNASWM